MQYAYVSLLHHAKVVKINNIGQWCILRKTIGMRLCTIATAEPVLNNNQIWEVAYVFLT